MDLHAAFDELPEGGLIPATERGLVRLTGEQRVWFLQNTISNDVDEVEPGGWVWSCFLDPKGKVLAHFRVGVMSDAVWLDVDPPGTPDLVDWFTRYRFRTKVEIEDVSPGAQMVLGDAAAALAAPGTVQRRDGGVVFGDELAGTPLAVVHGVELTDAEPVAASLYEALRIAAGVGRFGVDYGPDTLPQEAGLTREVSVTKGCYVGQEVMARLHFRGHVNRVVRTITVPDADVGEELVGADATLDGKRIGSVTSAVRVPGGPTIALGIVRVEPSEGTEVEVGGRAGVLGPVPEGTKVKTG